MKRHLQSNLQIQLANRRDRFELISLGRGDIAVLKVTLKRRDDKMRSPNREACFVVVCSCTSERRDQGKERQTRREATTVNH